MTNPGGAVAIWHDIVPEGLDEFYSWHGEEHMPERVGIAGFLRGRRYSAIDAETGFFNLYETASPDVVKGPDYKARLDAPTPRTLSAVKHFRNVARALCAVTARAGTAQGGVVATLRYDVEAGGQTRHLDALRRDLLPGLAALPGIAAAQALAADAAASGYVNAEQRARGGANAVPLHTLIVEGWADERAFMDTLRGRLRGDTLRAIGITGEGALGFYRHQVTVAR